MKERPELPPGRQHLQSTPSPLDWPAIDRLLLFGGYLGLFLLAVAGALAGALRLEQQVVSELRYLNVPVASATAALCGAVSVVVLGFVLAALSRRTREDAWSAMEYVVIYAYLAVVLWGVYVTSSYFGFGIMAWFLGATLGSILLDIGKIKTANLLATLAIVGLMALDVRGDIPHAPLFNLPALPSIDRTPLSWLLVEATVAVFFGVAVFINIALVGRWLIREEGYRQKSTTDGLTKLMNRQSFIERAQIELSRSERRQSPIACIILDIDHFKRVNDTYGHPVGDRALVAVADTLAKTARSYDLVSRYGGEEFVLLLPDTDSQAALGIAGRIRKNIMALVIEVGDQRLSMTASLGVASAPADVDRDIRALLSAVDEALYEAKSAGRNRAILYERPAATPADTAT